MQEEYFFVFFPKILREQQFTQVKQLCYLLSIFQGTHQIDKVILTSLGKWEMPPYLKNQSPKLSFKEGLESLESNDPTRLQIRKGQELIGVFHMRTSEYIQRMVSSQLSFFSQKAQITRCESLQFQLIIGSTLEQIDRIMLEYYAQPEERDLFKSMQEANHKDNEFKSSKTEQINNYISPLKDSMMQLNPHDFDQEESVNSSIPNDSTPYAFKINLQQVPLAAPPILAKESPKKISMIEIQKACYLNWKDKSVLVIYVLLSLIAIYLSTFSMKRL